MFFLLEDSDSEVLDRRTCHNGGEGGGVLGVKGIDGAMWGNVLTKIKLYIKFNLRAIRRFFMSKSTTFCFKYSLFFGG